MTFDSSSLFARRAALKLGRKNQQGFAERLPVSYRQDASW
jgi:hypothetical protein